MYNISLLLVFFRSFKLRWNYKRNSVYPVNFNHYNRPRRQDWAGELIETGAFYIFRRDLVKKGYLQNNKYDLQNITWLAVVIITELAHNPLLSIFNLLSTIFNFHPHIM